MTQITGIRAGGKADARNILRALGAVEARMKGGNDNERSTDRSDHSQNRRGHHCPGRLIGFSGCGMEERDASSEFPLNSLERVSAISLSCSVHLRMPSIICASSLILPIDGTSFAGFPNRHRFNAVAGNEDS